MPSPYDIVIIGGGITGAGIARDAALRGMRVALFEKNDFGAGTSSKSSKLIHGGLRYLERGEIGLVLESVSERRIQSEVAPHLVRPMRFVVPVYKDTKPGLTLINIGLWIYEALARFRSPKRHKVYRGAKAHALVPALKTDDLVGALAYSDCATDDARLVLENILDAIESGAHCHNHSEVIALERDRDRRIRGVVVRNALTGESESHPCRIVVCAAGPWTDELLADTVSIPMGRKLLRPTKGVHAVFPLEKLPIDHAITLMSPVDGRVMFAIPWRERLVIGTTDTDFRGHPDDVHADADDIRYLCDSANKYFPGARFRPDEVLSTWAGLRPLIQDEGATSESDVSREHEIFVRPKGAVIIAGGKLTTYRRMATEVVEAAQQWLHDNDADFENQRIKPKTHKRPLPGGVGLPPPDNDALAGYIASWARAHGVELELATHLVCVYGARAEGLLAMIRSAPKLGRKLDPELPYIWAEVKFAVQHDLAKTVTDVLTRRIPLLLVSRTQGLDVVDEVASMMAADLGWSTPTRDQYVEAYREEVANSRRFRGETRLPTSHVA